MPLFEFQCKNCENIFEDLVLSNEIPKCPQCQSEKTEKLISRPCRNKGAGGSDNDVSTSSSSSACGSCRGGSCSTCGS